MRPASSISWSVTPWWWRCRVRAVQVVGGVAGQEAGVVGDVDAEPPGQVAAAPRLRGVVVAVEVEGVAG